MSLGNPGYPEPTNVSIVTASGFTLKVGVKWVTVKMDRGVPTPVWELVLDGESTLSNIVVDHLEGDIPRGCIIQFPQAGDATENAQKIIARSGKALRDKLGLTREVDPTGGRIEPA